MEVSIWWREVSVHTGGLSISIQFRLVDIEHSGHMLKNQKASEGLYNLYKVL